MEKIKKKGGGVDVPCGGGGGVTLWGWGVICYVVVNVHHWCETNQLFLTDFLNGSTVTEKKFQGGI